MLKEPSTISIEYDKHRGIFLKFYDVGFFSKEIEITDIVQDCVIEKLMDENDLQFGDELVFKREIEPTQKIKKILGKFEK